MPRAARSSCTCGLNRYMAMRGNQRSRKQIGRQHREHHRFGQRNEQIARHAGQQEHRQEHDADAQASKPAPAPQSGARLPESPALLPECVTRLRWMFSISTVASSTRMPTASASPPSVMMLIVSPRALITQMETRIESGIETAMMMVLRQLPRNSRIMAAVRQAAMIASRMTPLTAARTKMDWSAIGSIFSSFGRRSGDGGQRFAHLLHDLQSGSLAGLHDGHQDAALAVAQHDVGLRRKAVAHVRHIVNIDAWCCSPP